MYDCICNDLVKLEDEPPLDISRIIAIDGNNSLKRMRPANSRQATNTHTLKNSQYFLPRSEVDRFEHEVKGRQKKGPAVGSNPEDASDVDDDDLGFDVEERDDAADGTSTGTGNGDGEEGYKLVFDFVRPEKMRSVLHAGTTGAYKRRKIGCA